MLTFSEFEQRVRDKEYPLDDQYQRVGSTGKAGQTGKYWLIGNEEKVTYGQDGHEKHTYTFQEKFSWPKLFESLPANSSLHPYCEQKQLSGNHIARVVREPVPEFHCYQGNLIVPIYRDGRIVGVQKIYEKDQRMHKIFSKGLKKQGAYCPILNFKSDSELIFLCEGFATACTVFEAIGRPTIAGLDSGNLLSVARKIREGNPLGKIVICADKDIALPGELGQGEEAARKVCEQVDDCEYILPEGIPHGDFNDLASATSHDEIERQLAKTIPIKKQPVEEEEIVFPELPGVLGQIQEYILSCSPLPRKDLAAASTLAMAGTVLANKVSFQGTSPCLYQVLIAKSGEGKDEPLKAPRKVFAQLGLINLIGLGNYRGDRSFLRKFDTQRERIDTLDEATRLFNSINSKTNNFQAALGDTLSEIWSANPGEFFRGAETDSISIGTVYGPALSLLCATTPSGFRSSFTKGNLEQGLGGRMLYVFSTHKAELQRNTNFGNITGKAKKWLVHWGHRKITSVKEDVSSLNLWKHVLDESKGKVRPEQILSLERPVPTELYASLSVENRLWAIKEYFHELKDRPEYEEARPIVNRAYQQVLKLTIISCCATNMYTDNEIKMSDVNFAFSYMQASLKMAKTFLAENLIETRLQLDTERVLSLLKKYPKGISKQNLTFHLRNHFRSKGLYGEDGIVTSLVDSNMVKQFTKENARWYILDQSTRCSS